MLVSAVYKSVTLNDSRDFTDVIKLIILVQKDYPLLNGEAQLNHKEPNGNRRHIIVGKREAIPENR